MAEADDMSFEILGTTPMNSYNGNSTGDASLARNSGLNSSLGMGMETELNRMRLSSSGGSINGAPMSPLSPSNGFQNKENRQDIAMDILLRRKVPSAEFLHNFKLPSLNAEFPSLSSANLTEEDLNKLQMIIAEHQQLKENLLKANSVIRQYFTVVEKWQNDVKQSKEADRQKISLLVATNQKLQNDLRQLQAEQDGQMNRERSPAQQQQQQPSPVNSDVDSLKREIETLRHELAQSKESTKEMVSKQMHKNVERQCSQLLAENLQFKDMEQQYIDTINCLKVNHASTEELVRMGQMDLNAERAANQKIMGELNNVKEENQVLIQQAEIYQKDFIAERDARQRMAGEKDEVINELNRLRMMLQQQQQPPQQQPGMSAPGHFGLVRYTCPSCYSQFNSQQLLGQHLPHCGRHN